MDGNALILLDSLLEEKRRQAGEEAPPADDLFELFCIEQLLKVRDLSEEELLAGQVGGGDDGGIDGIYCFLEDSLLAEDDDVLTQDFDPRKVKTNSKLSLVVIQAKREAGFSETAVQKLEDTLREILDLAKDDDDLAQVLSPELVARAKIFRRAWDRLATRHPTISVETHYATRGNTRFIHAKVLARGGRLEDAIADLNPRASCRVGFVGARELVDLAAQEKSYTLELSFQEMSTADNGHILLVALGDYLSFISEDGVLRKHIFDWNVRDYEGDVEVNREIAETLGDPAAPEFWWLNNGVTVICSEASTRHRVMSLDDVQVVNGLQTSVSIFDHLSAAPPEDRAWRQRVLVRVIETQDATTRDKVIRATNRQTAVQPASLRATDTVQRDLERYFSSEGWFYERRKNYYRNQGKPSERIVTIPYLAQAVSAIGFSDPSSSRARPSSLLKRDADYSRIFDPRVDYGIYLWLAKVQKSVDALLRSAKFRATHKTNFRFHISMVTVAMKHGARVHDPSQLANLVGTAITPLEVSSALNEILDALEGYLSGDAGPRRVDRAVKSREFTKSLLTHLFPQ